MSDNKAVLIVGAGSIGERHLRCFQATGRVRLSICDKNAGLRQRIAERYGINRVHEDLDSALKDTHHAAVIATPANLHVSMSLRLAEAGTHLLIEKPLSTSLDGIDDLQDALARRRLVAAVAYVLRTHPALAAMKQRIDSGRFGQPVQLVATGGQHFPTYRPAYREIYYADRATGGGAIQDALTHTMNAGQWLVGPIDRLVADAAHRVLEGVDVEDTVGLLARHGEVLGSYALNQHQAPNELTMTVLCEEGTARFELHRNRWRWTTQPDSPWQDERFDVQRDTLFVAQANAFLDAVEGRAAAICTLDEGLQTLRCNIAALASLENPGWQAVN